MDKIKILITKEYSDKTIKEFLKDNNIGRGKIETIRVNKQALINDNIVSLETKLKENDILSFIIEEEIDFIADNKQLDIVYEDEYVLIVNKPENIIIHPDDKSKGGTLVNLVAKYYMDNNINRRIRYIHRIDKETTGIVIFAKDFISEARLLKQIENNTLIRSYLAFVEGKLERKNGVINAPIGQDRHINNKMCISKNGKKAISEYEVIKEYKDYSLVKFTLKTGRTHQIRVHSSYIKHPLLGDVMYGGNYQYVDRVALHSYDVEFIHPINNKKINVKCELPKKMEIFKK